MSQRETRVVLIADDSVTVRAFLRGVLTEQGFAVLEAVDGVSALAALSANQKIDLVLTDLNMPGLDGISLVRKIRSHPVHSQVPVIVQTSEAQGSVIAIGKEAVATGWLTKPINEQRLLLIVQRLVGPRSRGPDDGSR